jgi:hypothetical protein
MWDTQQPSLCRIASRSERGRDVNGAIAAAVIDPDHLTLRTPTCDEIDYGLSGLRKTILFIEKRHDKGDAWFQQHMVSLTPPS